MFQQISLKLLNMKFHKNPFSRSRVVTDGQTDGENVIDAFLQHLVANSSKNTCEDAGDPA
jgi:hypothetical protein